MRSREGSGDRTPQRQRLRRPALRERRDLEFVRGADGHSVIRTPGLDWSRGFDSQHRAIARRRLGFGRPRRRRARRKAAYDPLHPARRRHVGVPPVRRADRDRPRPAVGGRRAHVPVLWYQWSAPRLSLARLTDAAGSGRGTRSAWRGRARPLIRRPS
jgi:hypothetical protein